MGSKERASRITNTFIDELKGKEDPLPYLINKQFTSCATCGKLKLCTGYFLPPLKRDYPILEDKIDLDQLVTAIKFIEDRTTKEERISLIKDILDLLNIDNDFMVNILEDLFSTCYQYNYFYQSITDNGYENRIVLDLEEDNIEDRPDHFKEVVDKFKDIDNEYTKKYCMAIHIVYSKCANCRIRNSHGGEILSNVIDKLMERVLKC